MLRDLACTFPEFLQTLVAAEAGWTNSERLTDFIYPHSVFTAEAKTEQEREQAPRRHPWQGKWKNDTKEHAGRPSAEAARRPNKRRVQLQE